VGGSLLPWRTITAGPLRQDALLDRADVAVFTSTVLAEPLEIVGDVSVDLYVSATAAPADWVVKLCEVDEDGSTRNVTDGVLRHREPAPSPVRIQVDLQPTAIVIPAGHRLRLLVATSDFPRYDRSPAGTQCIYVGGAHPSTVVIATSA
jgi:putative CocE/NonD family hydrolase